MDSLQRAIKPGSRDGMMSISEVEFTQLRNLIYKRFGINLTQKKKSLVVGRLQKHIRKLGMENFSSYYKHIISEKSGKALTELVNHISTNFTYFWREPAHFEHLRDSALKELTEILKRRSEYDIRIWCAAAATGEEPYMLAILLKEFLAGNEFKWKAGILATDISDRALTTAQNGIYEEKSLDKMPPRYKKKYFRQVGAHSWQVVDEIRKEVTFRRFNLMNPLPFKKPFHIVFCRNVMIYFDIQTKNALIDRFYDGIENEGFLYIGHSEALNRKNNPFDYVMPALYRKPEQTIRGNDARQG